MDQDYRNSLFFRKKLHITSLGWDNNVERSSSPLEASLAYRHSRNSSFSLWKSTNRRLNVMPRLRLFFFFLLPLLPFLRTIVRAVSPCKKTRKISLFSSQLVRNLDSIFKLNVPLPGNEVYSWVLGIWLQKSLRVYYVGYQKIHPLAIYYGIK